MKVLVTGHLGFVGSSTTVALEARGDTVIGYDIGNGQDLADHSLLHQTVFEARPDVILHEAAIARFADADADPLLAHQVNVIGTRQVVATANYFHIPLVFASTGSVYMPLAKEPPITEDFPVAGNSIYGVTKLLAEKYVEQATVPTIILRYAHLYGATKIGHGLIGGFRAAIEAGKAPSLLGGDQTNDFTYIDDVVRANLAAIDAPMESWNEVYNIGTGIELSAKDAGVVICEVFGYDGPIEIKPARSVDPSRFVYDVRKAERSLGWTPRVSFEEGLRDTQRQLVAA